MSPARDVYTVFHSRAARTAGSRLRESRQSCAALPRAYRPYSANAAGPKSPGFRSSLLPPDTTRPSPPIGGEGREIGPLGYSLS